MLKKTKLSYVLINLIFILLISGSASAATKYNMNINNYSRQLLKILKWDDRYEQDRNKDVNYLLGNISGEKLKDLTSIEKEQVILSMRQSVFEQMMKEKETFRNYLLTQYNQFFTADELGKLIAYFKTSMMQMIVSAQIERKQLTIEDINKALKSSDPLEKNAIERYADSYLSARYNRFQEKVTTQMNDMIYARLQEVLTIAVNKLPELIVLIKAQGNIKPEVNKT